MNAAAKAVLGTVSGGGTLAAAIFSPALAYVVGGVLLITVVGVLVIAGCVIHRNSDKPIERVERIIGAIRPAAKDPQPSAPVSEAPAPIPEQPAVPEVLKQPALPAARPRRRPRHRPSAGSGNRPPTGSGTR